jgi:hypothetical protein
MVVSPPVGKGLHEPYDFCLPGKINLAKNTSFCGVILEINYLSDKVLLYGTVNPPLLWPLISQPI